jgi:subtilisin family serine protease
MKSKLLLSLFVFVFGVFHTINGQHESENIIPGRMMVKMHDLQDLSSLTQSLSNYSFSIERILSHHLRIALLSYDEKQISANEVLTQVRSFPSVILAQHDHVVQLREIEEEVIPNDPLFGLQWSLHNTGQMGGLPGADIDALSAWEITTGGLTAHGDTIVVAVIDSGCDINHVDLNLFKNWQEIPGNGIDDDGNGYIDDFHGWNAYNNSGNIPPSNHGTHVSGTVGAKGNNNTGVTGVNWNVKVLPIAGSSSIESTVVAAYAYVYAMRKHYDETNGEYGAFIVATNSSFGVNYGQPHNYPIWGAMYDSLGTLGILSAAATANTNINVDVVGDIPTAFPSPYILSVTNTTNMDVKNTGAAYGATTIDLGAPGTQIYSTRNNNTYGYSTGTSMATPHVSGAVALLMAVADSAFVAHYKENPAEAALELKQHIIEGTDTIPSLQGITVSGGRLNVYKPMLTLLNLLPDLRLTADTISVKLDPGKMISKKIYLANTGKNPLNFNLTTAGRPLWVRTDIREGIIPGQDSIALVIDFHASGLTPGIYQTTIEIDTDHGQQQAVEVELQVLNTHFVHNRQASESNIKVWPNPFRDIATFRIETSNESMVYISVTDPVGRLIMEEAFQQPASGIAEWHLRVRDLPVKSKTPGLYFYRIVTDENIYSGKLWFQP